MTDLMLPATRSVVLLVEEVSSGDSDFLLGAGSNFEVIRWFGEIGALDPGLESTLDAIFVSMADPVAGASKLAQIRNMPRFDRLPVMVIVPPRAVGLADDLRRTGALVTVPPPAPDLATLEDMLAQSRAAGTSLRPLPLSFELDVAELFSANVTQACFEFGSMEEARTLARLVASVCPDPARQGFGLEELMLNAVEHGILGMDGAVKAEHIRAGTWLSEVNTRLGATENRGKRASVSFERDARGITIRVRDCGEGFDWRSVIARGVTGTSEPNGRGVVLARLLAFDRLDYIDPGNEVVARVRVQTEASAQVAAGPPPADSPGRALSSIDHMRLCERFDGVLAEASDVSFYQDVLALSLAELASEVGAFGYLDEGGSLICPAFGTPVTCSAKVQDAVVFPKAGLGELLTQVVEKRQIVLGGGGGPSLEGLPMQRCLCAPVELRGEIFGVVVAGNKATDYDADDRDRLALIARRVAPGLTVRVSRMVAARNEALERMQKHIQSEQVLASRVLAKVRQEGCLDTAGFRYVMAALDVFNGDIALAAWTPSGELRWLLGDFTGHGLGAAVGTIPIASIFYTTTRKGIPIVEMLKTVNDQLEHLLPSGLFCAAVVLSLSPDGTMLSAWNGAMPPAYVLSTKGERVRRIASIDLPLGVVESSMLQLTFAQFPIERGDEILIFSDGLIEAADTRGERFGLDRVEQIVKDAAPGTSFERLLQQVALFRGEVGAEDDVSLVEFTVGKNAAQASPTERRMPEPAKAT
jgi:serine phosphatase RsbU (regulator of sigma subunit)